jgi:hypothetical protein
MQAFSKITVPLSAPGVFTAAILLFIQAPVPAPDHLWPDRGRRERLRRPATKATSAGYG